MSWYLQVTLGVYSTHKNVFLLNFFLFGIAFDPFYNGFYWTKINSSCEYLDFRFVSEDQKINILLKKKQNIM